MKKLLDRLMDRVAMIPETGCWLWTGGWSRNGYGLFTVTSPHRRNMLAHRLVYETSIGPIPDGCSVLHRCDTPSCVNPGHMFLGSQSDNMADMAGKKRSTHGSKNAMAKLTEADVVAIRERSKFAQQKVLANEFGVSRATISLICSGKTWCHAKGA